MTSRSPNSSLFDARSFVARIDEARALLGDLQEALEPTDPKRLLPVMESISEAKVQLAMAADTVEAIFDV